MPRPKTAGVIQEICASTNSFPCEFRLPVPRCGSQPGALPTQRIEPRFRLLDSAGFSLCIEIACLRRVAARPIGSPFGKNERVIGLRQREACLSVACLGGAFEHNSRRANIALPEQHARARHQPCHLRGIFGIGRSGASSGCDACLVGCDWLCRVRLELLVLSALIGGHDLRCGRRSFWVSLEPEGPLPPRRPVPLPPPPYAHLPGAPVCPPP